MHRILHTQFIILCTAGINQAGLPEAIVQAISAAPEVIRPATAILSLFTGHLTNLSFHSLNVWWLHLLASARTVLREHPASGWIDQVSQFQSQIVRCFVASLVFYCCVTIDKLLSKD